MKVIQILMHIEIVEIIKMLINNRKPKRIKNHIVKTHLQQMNNIQVLFKKDYIKTTIQMINHKDQVS